MARVVRGLGRQVERLQFAVKCSRSSEGNQKINPVNVMWCRWVNDAVKK